MINIKKLITFVFLSFTLTCNLISHPITFTRFQNERTGQILDLYSELHIENDFILYSNICHRILHLFKNLNPETTTFIWEKNAQRQINPNYFIDLAALTLQKLFPQSFIAADQRDDKLAFLGYMNLRLETPWAIEQNPTLSTNPTIKEVINNHLEKNSIASKGTWFDMSHLPNRIQELLKLNRDRYNKAIEYFLKSQAHILDQNLLDFYKSFYFNSFIFDNDLTDLDIAFRVSFNKFYNIFNKLFVDSLFDFEIIKNIFSSNKQYIIVYAGVAHTANIKTFLKTNNLEFKCIFDGPEEQILKNIGNNRQYLN